MVVLSISPICRPTPIVESATKWIFFLVTSSFGCDQILYKLQVGEGRIVMLDWELQKSLYHRVLF